MGSRNERHFFFNVLDLAVGGGDPFPFEKKCQLVSKV